MERICSQLHNPLGDFTLCTWHRSVSAIRKIKSKIKTFKLTVFIVFTAKARRWKYRRDRKINIDEKVERKKMEKKLCYSKTLSLYLPSTKYHERFHPYTPWKQAPHMAALPSSPLPLPTIPPKPAQEEEDYGESTPGMGEGFRAGRRARENTWKTLEVKRKQLYFWDTWYCEVYWSLLPDGARQVFRVNPLTFDVVFSHSFLTYIFAFSFPVFLLSFSSASSFVLMRFSSSFHFYFSSPTSFHLFLFSSASFLYSFSLCNEVCLYGSGRLQNFLHLICSVF